MDGVARKPARHMRLRPSASPVNGCRADFI
jgi:hypothetical protein